MLRTRMHSILLLLFLSSSPLLSHLSHLSPPSHLSHLLPRTRSIIPHRRFAVGPEFFETKKELNDMRYNLDGLGLKVWPREDYAKCNHARLGCFESGASELETTVHDLAALKASVSELETTVRNERASRVGSLYATGLSFCYTFR